MNKKTTKISRGEIYYVCKGIPAQGSEQEAGRPAIIVSNNTANSHSSIVEVVYLTSQPKNDLPTHCTIRATGKPSTVLCEQIQSVFVDRLDGYLGMASATEMAMIDNCLAISLGLPDAPPKVKKAASVEEAERIHTLEVENRLLREQYDSLLQRILSNGGV